MRTQTKRAINKTLWSATPTPFNAELAVEEASVRRLVDHHAGLGVEGVMLGGSCGEGPWMPVQDLEALVRCAVEHNAGRLRLAAQVTDNSAKRMLDHIERMAAAGADRVVIAAPYFMMNPTPERILGTYVEVITKSPLPVIYYDRGAGDRYRVSNEQLTELLSLENLVMVKDSSCDPLRLEIGQQVKGQRPELMLLTGDEFGVAEALTRGMDGAFLGGAIFNAPLVFDIYQALQEDDPDRAQTVQKSMNELMLKIYGGPKISAWLTGLKYFLVRLGLFSGMASYLEYPLSDAVRSEIDGLFEASERKLLVARLERASQGGR